MSDLPDPVTRDQQFLRGVCDRIDAQNKLLSQVLDRMPAPPVADAKDGTVELREPHIPQGLADDEKASDISEERPAPSSRRTRKTNQKAKTASRESP